MFTDDMSLDYLSFFSDILKLEKLVLFMVSIAVLLFASKAIKLFSHNLCDKLPSRRILIFQVTTVIIFFLHIVGGFYIFYKLFNPPKELLIALLGSATVAIGFSLKDLVGSLISGITLILDPPFQVGDRVKFKDIYGEIKYIGLRAVRIQTLDMQIVTIPNLNFTNEAILCANKGKLNLNVCSHFYVSLENDIKKIEHILRETVISSRYAYLEEPVVTVIEQVWKVDVLCYEIVLKAHVLDARYEKDFQTDIYTRAIKALQEHGVKFPQKIEHEDEQHKNNIIEMKNSIKAA